MGGLDDGNRSGQEAEVAGKRELYCSFVTFYSIFLDNQGECL